MKDFDSLKNMWQADDGESTGRPTTFQISKTSQNARMKLERSQFFGSILLILTAVLIGAMAVFGNFNFQHWYTYAAMALVCMVCLGQASVMYYTYLRLKRIDESAPPAAHLQQWEAYYAYRERLIKYNMPVYFIALNLAMGVYLYEVLLGRPILNVSIFLSLYIGWMLFAIFYLGKKTQRKEEKRLNEIIGELKSSAMSLGRQDKI